MKGKFGKDKFFYDEKFPYFWKEEVQKNYSSFFFKEKFFVNKQSLQMGNNFIFWKEKIFRKCYVCLLRGTRKFGGGFEVSKKSFWQKHISFEKTKEKDSLVH